GGGVADDDVAVHGGVDVDIRGQLVADVDGVGGAQSGQVQADAAGVADDVVDRQSAVEGEAGPLEAAQVEGDRGGVVLNGVDAANQGGRGNVAQFDIADGGGAVDGEGHREVGAGTGDGDAGDVVAVIDDSQERVGEDGLAGGAGDLHGDDVGV